MMINLLLPIPTPFLYLPKGIDEHTRINDNDISLFGNCLLGVFGPAVLCCAWTLLLLLLVLLMSMCGGGDPDTPDGELTTL